MQVILETAGGQCTDCPYMYKSAGISCCNVYNDVCDSACHTCEQRGALLTGEYISNWRDDCKGCRWCDKDKGYCRLHRCNLLKYPRGLILKCKACADGTKRDYSALGWIILIGGLLLLWI
jgi:hypothetical protein